MGLQVNEIVDESTGELLNYEGNFIYVDREILHTIEDVAAFVLDLLDEQIGDKALAEFWLFTKNPNYYCFHNCNVDGYSQSYPMEKYSQNSIIKKIINNK